MAVSLERNEDKCFKITLHKELFTKVSRMRSVHVEISKLKCLMKKFTLDDLDKLIKRATEIIEINCGIRPLKIVTIQFK